MCNGGLVHSDNVIVWRTIKKIYIINKKRIAIGKEIKTERNIYKYKVEMKIPLASSYSYPSFPAV